MPPSSPLLRSLILAFAISGSVSADPLRVVFQGGASLPVTSLILQGGNLVVNAEENGYTIGQTFPLQTADHIYGDRPAEISQGLALLMLDKPKDALKLLEQSVARQRHTAKIPGNFWLEAARATLMAHALSGNNVKANELGKEISEATPEAGIDPFVSLGKALLIPETEKPADRVQALKDLITDDTPANVSAYASYFIGNLLKEDKKPAEALESYLAVSGIYPTGGLMVNAGASVKAAELLISSAPAGLSEELQNGRRMEAIDMLKSARNSSADTALAQEINKRLESLK